MRFATLLFLCFVSLGISAQDELTVAEINRQSAFIQAKQEALLGKTDAAITKFEELAADDEADDAVQFELGRLYKAKEELSEAIDHLQKAYAARPTEVYAAFLANLYQETGRHKEGAALYAELRKSAPGDEDLYLEEAAFLVRAQDIKGAIEVYNLLEERIGVNEELARLKHSLYLGSGDERRAEKELLSLVEAQPSIIAHRHLLAGFYTAQNDSKAAEKTYREILKIEPADVRAQLALQDASLPVSGGGNQRELMELLGRTDVDIDLKIGKILPLVQDIARSQTAAGSSEATAGKIASGIQMALELQRVHPDEAKASALLGDIYFQSGQLNEAADAYIATLKLDDNVYPVWEQLLGTLYLANRISDLRKYAEEALDLYPNRPAIFVHYAIGEALRSNFGDANSLLDEAKLMVSTQAMATKSLDELSRAFTLLAGTPPAGTITPADLPGGESGPVAFLISNSRDLAALKAYDRPGNTNSMYLERLGDALVEAGETDAAAKAYTRAKAAGSKSKALPGKLSKVGS